MTGEHASAELLARYRRGAEIDGEQEWALEAHLETCGDCRTRLGGDRLVETVWQRLEPELATQPRRRHLRGVRAWSLPGMVSWAAASAFVTLVAGWLGATSPGNPLLLVAPVLPVAGVFVASGVGFDAAYEVVSATPRAGLELLLRRTAMVLAGMEPVLLLAGSLFGTSAGVALLPALGLTAGSLALGSFIGVRRSAALLAAGWVIAEVVGRRFAGGLWWLETRPAVAGWAVLAVGAAVVVVRRREAFGRTPLVKF